MQPPRLDPAIVPSSSARGIAQLAYRAVLSSLHHRSGDTAIQVRGLPRHWRAVYTVCWLDFEVRNGGHHQFFWNSEGRLNDETLADLELIGAEAAAAIFRGALSVFAGHDYAGKKARAVDFLAAFSAANPENAMSPLDHAFYTLPKSPTQFLGAFIKANVTLFMT
jgi:Domain of unknown function (DUF4375)